MLNDKLKQKDAAHALAVAEIQSAVGVSEERRLEVIRLREEVKRLKEAEKQRLDEVETLRKNGEDLKLKLKEAVDAHDQMMHVKCIHELFIILLIFQSYLHHIRVISLFYIDFGNIPQVPLFF